MATKKQIEALTKIHAAGGSLEFYGKSSTTGRRISPVLINGNCARALHADGLAVVTWSASGQAQIATLTEQGRAALDCWTCPGDWTANDGCCGRCAGSRAMHQPKAKAQPANMAGAGIVETMLAEIADEPKPSEVYRCGSQGRVTRMAKADEPKAKAPKLTTADRAFLAYLTGTLIPDLDESGRDGMTQDFERCVAIIKRLAGER